MLLFCKLTCMCFSVCIFVEVFLAMDVGTLQAETLVTVSTILAGLGYLLHTSLIYMDLIQSQRRCKL